DITPKFYRILKQFAPFGPGNMAPVFMTQHLKDTGQGKCVGKDKKHLRVVVKQGNSAAFTGIGFGMGDKHGIACGKKHFKAAYTLMENEWNGNRTLQLGIKDIKN
ncbi:MAG: single-stranded-DNA-specific exonuclease RecJ, partial [Marinirhabdus sp.]